MKKNKTKTSTKAQGRNSGAKSNATATIKSGGARKPKPVPVAKVNPTHKSLVLKSLFFTLGVAILLLVAIGDIFDPIVALSFTISFLILGVHEALYITSNWRRAIFLGVTIISCILLYPTLEVIFKSGTVSN